MKSNPETLAIGAHCTRRFRIFCAFILRPALSTSAPKPPSRSTTRPEVPFLLFRNPPFSMSSLLRAPALFALIALSTVVVWSLPAASAADRPNLILIIADDMSPEDGEPYGTRAARTPTLARLAREGMRFDAAFVTTSSCSPSRASIVTGRYPHQTGAAELHQPLPSTQIAFTEHLRKAGYWTAAAGKWHLGKPAQEKFDLVKEGGGPSGCENWVPVLRDRPSNQPFFLWLAAVDPHRDYRPGTIPQPHEAGDVTVPPYLPDTPEVRGDLARYYDEITRLDGYVGEVLAELERQGVAENTLILFISDNGRPFPRCKTTLYDSGIRTPWLVRWPAHVKPGTVSKRLVSTVDIAPTFLALGGAAPLSQASGQSFLPQLRDPAAPGREFVFAQRHWHDFGDFARAVRNERWKYIRNSFPELPNQPPADAVRSPTFLAMQQLYAAGTLPAVQSGPFLAPRPREELYDLAADPHELRNLAGVPQFEAPLKQLRHALDEFQQRTEDRIPERTRADEFHRETGERLKRE